MSGPKIRWQQGFANCRKALSQRIAHISLHQQIDNQDLLAHSEQVGQLLHRKDGT